MAENKKKVQIEDSWYEVLKEEFEKPYFAAIRQHLVQEKNEGHVVYPPGPMIFNAFNYTPFDAVKVVILGQDPYHGHGQAHGLSFSVPDGVKPPPSLKNIYKEIDQELELGIPTSGNLTSWANQGVFLLNAMLTVRASSAGSHSKIGWQTFTNAVISQLSSHKEGVIFLLWGKFAQGKVELIDEFKHYVLTSPHPSPFSAHTGFFGNDHFISANQFLEEQNLTPIDWSIPSA